METEAGGSLGVLGHPGLHRFGVWGCHTETQKQTYTDTDTDIHRDKDTDTHAHTQKNSLGHW